MGSCAFCDRSLSEICQGNISLSESNTQLLKFLSLYFIEKKQSVMAVKIINIKSITKDYYRSVRKERETVLTRKYLLDSEESSRLEQTVITEHQELQRTNQVLNNIVSSLVSSLFSFTFSIEKQILKYSENKELVYRYKELKARCLEYNRKGLGISSLVNGIGNGAQLTQEQEDILLNISRVTSHVANNPNRRMSYSFRGVRNFRHKTTFSLGRTSYLSSISNEEQKTLKSENSLYSD